MASTPSASALTAVLRCRGKILARNPPSKRPATSTYSLGLAGVVVVLNPPAERTARSHHQASTWETFLQGERVAVGRRLAVSYRSPRVNGKALRVEDYSDIDTLRHPKLSQSPRNARSDVQHALVVRQLVHRLTSNLPGIDHFFQMIKYETYAATQICKTAFLVQETSAFPAGVLKVSIASPRLMEHAGRIPSFVLSGWSTLKRTCLSLTSLVSQFMFLRLGGICRPRSGISSSPYDAPQHLDEENITNNALQAKGHIQSPAEPTISNKDNSDSGQRITEDRPD